MDKEIAVKKNYLKGSPGFFDAGKCEVVKHS